MSEEKTMCDRVGKDYVYILEKMCSILRHYQTNFYIDDKAIEKIEELCLGIETGKMEIIEFGQVLSKRNNVDKYKEVLDKISDNIDLELLKTRRNDDYNKGFFDGVMSIKTTLEKLLEEIE